MHKDLVSLSAPDTWCRGRRIFLSGALALLAACSGGGGGGGGNFSRSGELTGISFPDPAEINATALDVPPTATSLVQQIVLSFTGAPSPDEVNGQRILIQDPRGTTVPGSFHVSGNDVIFTPALPTRASTSPFDNGGAGLLPGTTYSVTVGPRTWPGFVTGVSSDLRKLYPDGSDANGIRFVFSTTATQELFFMGIEEKSPRLVATDPPDGTSNVSPQLYGDPDGLFPSRRRPFVLTFDAPLNPDNLNLDAFQLIDLDNRTSEHPTGQPVGILVTLLENSLEGARVEIQPSGILPFGHLLSLEYPTGLRGLSTQSTDPLTETRVAATLQVAPDPNVPVIRDLLAEDFDSDERADVDAVEPGNAIAEWNTLGSGVLQAGFAFKGNGELGSFRPIPPDDGEDTTVILDTSVQRFPLLDGSTPEAPPDTSVRGGVFAFTDIDIPEGVTIRALGPNPLILTATGSVRIAGRVDLSGQDGTGEATFDSANTSLPGGNPGPGGGRGGEGQPLFFRGGVVGNATVVSPPRGGQGWGPRNRERIGGTGGQSGMLDTNINVNIQNKPRDEECPENFVEEKDIDGVTRCIRRIEDDAWYELDKEINCDELNNRHHLAVRHHSQNYSYKPPGGGGGSFFQLGADARSPGIGNVLADGQGNYMVRRPNTHGETWDELDPGRAGQAVFRDEDPNNDFIGSRGELKEIQGGQGGGAGGSALDSYFCGNWCDLDDNPDNDRICSTQGNGFLNGNPARFGDSTADSRGGAAGGGGGAFAVESLGDILVTSSAAILCNGGRGGRGEQVACSNYSGSGGSGSGGAIILRSATDIHVEEGANINVAFGGFQSASQFLGAYVPPPCFRLDASGPGSSGRGGRGIIQLQVPFGKVANVERPSDLTGNAWSDRNNIRNPVEFTPFSQAASEWYDMGWATTRAPQNATPSFRFRGLDSEGFVMTDDDGFVTDPSRTDIRVDYLGQVDPDQAGEFLPGQEPRSHFIPPNASVRVEFQGANAVAPGSKEIDPATLMPGPDEWSPKATIADGMQFIRYRVTFNVAENPDIEFPGIVPPLPTVQKISIRAEF